MICYCCSCMLLLLQWRVYGDGVISSAPELQESWSQLITNKVLTNQNFAALKTCYVNISYVRVIDCLIKFKGCVSLYATSWPSHLDQIYITKLQAMTRDYICKPCIEHNQTALCNQSRFTNFSHNIFVLYLLKYSLWCRINATWIYGWPSTYVKGHMLLIGCTLLL